MGQAGSRLTRPIRNFNVENRAAKVIDKRATVPDPAPKYEASEIMASRFREEHPELVDSLDSKSDDLHERLKQIYVDTKDAPIKIRSMERPPPLSREVKPDTELGVMDVDYAVPKGKADLKTLLHVIGQNQLHPNEHTAAYIAKTHDLDQTDVENILSHFYSLQISLPPEMLKQKNMNKIIQLQESAGNLVSTLKPKLSGKMSGKTEDSSNVRPNRNS